MCRLDGSALTLLMSLVAIVAHWELFSISVVILGSPVGISTVIVPVGIIIIVVSVIVGIIIPVITGVIGNIIISVVSVIGIALLGLVFNGGLFWDNSGLPRLLFVGNIQF